MSSSEHSFAAGSAVSAAVAASIAMTIGCVIWMIVTDGDAAQSLIWGTWFAAVAFGGTFAVVYFIGLARRQS